MGVDGAALFVDKVSTNTFLRKTLPTLKSVTGCALYSIRFGSCETVAQTRELVLNLQASRGILGITMCEHLYIKG